MLALIPLMLFLVSLLTGAFCPTWRMTIAAMVMLGLVAGTGVFIAVPAPQMDPYYRAGTFVGTWLVLFTISLVAHGLRAIVVWLRRRVTRRRARSEMAQTFE